MMLKHSRKKQNNTIILIVVVAILFIGGIVFLVKNNTKSSPVANVAAVDALAQCITEKGMKMYGASRCPHCKAQKALFGTSFAKVDYVECTTDQVKCNIAGIQGYPTRTFQGQKYEGEQSFEDLSKITGCPYNGPVTNVSGGSSATK